MNRSLPLSVVISREGSLSPRSRSGLMSPSRTYYRYVNEDRVPQQVDYQDVVALFRKWQNSKAKVMALEDEVTTLRRCLDKGDKLVRAARKTAEIAAEGTTRCKELKVKHKNMKGLLKGSMLESAKLSRKLVTKSRELDEAQHQIARIPALKSATERLLKDKSKVEETLNAEGRRLEEEKRRSRLWSDQVDELSLQVAKSTERCRELTIENSELGANLECAEGMLEQAKRRGSEAIAMVEDLRAVGLEAERLRQELGAVRADCGTLVQLVSSTKEYSYFRRLWDDSGGLTRINNAFHGGGGGSGVGRTTRGISGGNWISDTRGPGFEGSVDGGLAPPAGALLESSVRLSQNSTMKIPQPDATLPPPPSPLLPPEQQKIRHHRRQAAMTGTSSNQNVEVSMKETVKAAKVAAAAIWDEAMRSEWSSPSEKIISAAALTAKAETAAAAAPVAMKTVIEASKTTERGEKKASVRTGAATVSSDGEEEATIQGRHAKRGNLGGDSGGGGGRARADFAKPAAFVGRAISTTSSISGGEVVGGFQSRSRVAPVTAPASGVPTTTKRNRTTKTTTSSSTSEENTGMAEGGGTHHHHLGDAGDKETPTPMEQLALGDGTAGPAGDSFSFNDGGCGDRDGGCGVGLQRRVREVVRWGRLDLLSVLYPPPPPSGSATVTNPAEEAFMWVPREAAALCWRFFVDFDAQSALPPDAGQRRMVFDLLARLNVIWRKIERSRVGSVRMKYRAELAAARRRLEMRKPLEAVTAELTAERHRRCRRRGASSSTSYAIAVATARSSRPGRGGSRSPMKVWGIDGKRVRGIGHGGTVSYPTGDSNDGTSHSNARYKRRGGRVKKGVEGGDASCCGPRLGKDKGNKGPTRRNAPSSLATSGGC